MKDNASPELDWESMSLTSRDKEQQQQNHDARNNNNKKEKGVET
jgi:hypothetical protein